MKRLTAKTLVLVGALALPLTGCDGDTSQANVTLSREDGRAAAASTMYSLSEAEGAALSVDQVLSIDVTVTQVDAHASGTEEGGGWVTLQVVEPTSLNLLELPTDSAGALLLARGEVPAGDYDRLRLHVGESTVTFAEQVTIGSYTYPANEPVQLTVPNGRLHVNLGGLSLEESVEEVRLSFSPELTVRGVVATGSSQVNLPPVLTKK